MYVTYVSHTLSQYLFFVTGNVWCLLEEDHYPAFLVSEACYKMLEEAHEHAITIAEDDYKTFAQDDAEVAEVKSRNFSR